MYKIYRITQNKSIYTSTSYGTDSGIINENSAAVHNLITGQNMSLFLLRSRGYGETHRPFVAVVTANCKPVLCKHGVQRRYKLIAK